jgi:transcriptional antiterminator RfaH
MSADINDRASIVRRDNLGGLREQVGSNYSPRPASPLLRWFLILTKPAGENTAKSNLERQGYHVYYPRLLRPALYRGRWIDRIVSLFPRYLFVQLDAATQSLAPVRSTLGVANIVCFGAETTVVPATVVDGLIRRADRETGLHSLSRGRALEPGSAVRIIAGVFEGLEGIFEREGDNERVVVLLKLLSQDTPVRVPGRFVVPNLAT